jgi:putative membrane protein insertion efficiency factor
VKTPTAAVGLSARLALRLVRIYQLAMRPMLSGQCRYVPSCSEYAAEAIAVHGAVHGGWMGLARVMRCHPFGGWGFDPVPRQRSSTRPGNQTYENKII